MKLVFTGHDSAPLKFVSSTECQKKCDGNISGCFKYDYETNMDDKVLTVKFSCVTWVNAALKGKVLEDVKNHERRHQQDFISLANQLKTSLERVLAKGQDPDIDNRLKWFDYDVCVKSAAFHRQVGAMVEICFPPEGARPQ